MHSLSYLAPVAAALFGTVRAGFDPSSSTNVVVYYGQNSYGASTDPDQQQPLAFYCNSGSIDVINLAFLTVVDGVGGAPEINLANTGNNCTTFDGTSLLHCPQVAADIKTCQAEGVQVLLSIGGATYSEGGFSTSDAAVTAANNLWSIFGPQQSGSDALRPFDDASIDGFDFDFESTANNIASFISQMRTNFATDSSKSYLLSAAPQCPYPDAADGPFLDGTSDIDYVNVQISAR